MLFLTLLAGEGMARLAYYAAYGSGYAGGGSAEPTDITPPPPSTVNQITQAYLPPAGAEYGVRINHPFYAFTPAPAYAELNVMPPRQRREDTVVIALLGGSVAEEMKPFLQRALNRRFAARGQPRRPLVLQMAISSAKQPQQAMIVANALLLGGEFDLIVNLDGFNEIVSSAGLNPGFGVFPFFPIKWAQRVALTGEEALLAGQLGVLRREQARLAAIQETSPLRGSALFGLANRWRQERTAAAIIRRNHELAATATAYSLEKHGPRSWLDAEGERQPAAARVWQRSSVMLARLAAVAGADYYHFLQPNQYVPAAKPLSPEERELAWSANAHEIPLVAQGYPLLQGFCQDLRSQGINCFDLTGIFVDNAETLYKDKCCHLNERGYGLLAAAMVRRMEPSLRRLGGASPARPVSALATARRPAEPAASHTPPDTLAFQVSLQNEGKELRYVREDCAPEDTDPAFFLHLIPRDWPDRPPPSKQDFDSRSFRFAAAGGRFAPGQCRAQIPLPDYPIAALRTGQYIPGEDAPLWSVELIVPADPDQLRADYAALSTMQPVVRDFFDLYAIDNRLLYLRETCAAADTAAAFFLHIVPEDTADLPAERQAAGFAHSGFDFARQGGRFDGKCLAAVALPDYPIAAIRTGQHIPGPGDLWSVELIAAPNLDQLRADYAALSAAQPDARNYFDLYWREGRLLYLRESCAAADTAAAFFLHIVPAEVEDLPAERQAAGFAPRDFDFARRGSRFDGKCLASVPLPNYPGGIKEMRTGQFVPGQGDLWSAAIAVP